MNNNILRIISSLFILIFKENNYPDSQSYLNNAKNNLTQEDYIALAGNISNNTTSSIIKNNKCSKPSSKTVTSTGVTIRGTKSTVTRPVSSFSPASSTTSSTSPLSKNPHKTNQPQPTHIDLNMNVSCSSNIGAFGFFSPSSSINDSFRKKSGSVSALYLCDTASTKAKKAELKNSQHENNERHHLIQSQSSNGYSSNSSINRRNSMGKNTKVSVERNTNHGSIHLPINNNLMAYQQPNKESNITPFNSNGASVTSVNEYSTKKQHQTSNVFDRLSRSSKKLV